MAARLCFALVSVLATLATSLPQGGDLLYDEEDALFGGEGDTLEGEGAPLCECINPFLGTVNAYRYLQNIATKQCYSNIYTL